MYCHTTSRGSSVLQKMKFWVATAVDVFFPLALHLLLPAISTEGIFVRSYVRTYVLPQTLQWAVVVHCIAVAASLLASISTTQVREGLITYLSVSMLQLEHMQMPSAWFARQFYSHLDGHVELGQNRHHGQWAAKMQGACK